MTPLRQKVIDQMMLQGLSAATQKSYLYQLKEVAKYFHLSPDKLSETEIQSYLLYLIRDRHWSWSSCRQALHALSFLYRQVLKRPLGHMTLPHPKKTQKLPDLLYPDEVLNLIKECRHAKAHAAIVIAYSTGMRISEINALKVGDLDGEHNCIKVRQGKGNRDRYVLFPEGLKSELRHYWRMYRPTDVVIYGLDKHRALNSKYLRLEVKAAAIRAGITKTVRFHSLRHAFACHQLLAGMPLPRLQVLLGHTQLQTTFRYLQWVAMMDLRSKISEDLLQGLRSSS